MNTIQILWDLNQYFPTVCKPGSRSLEEVAVTLVVVSGDRVGESTLEVELHSYWTEAGPTTQSWKMTSPSSMYNSPRQKQQVHRNYTQQEPENDFKNGLWAHYSNIAKNHGDHTWIIMSNFVHVMTAELCANLWHDCLIRIRITTKRIFKRSKLWAYKCLVEWVSRDWLVNAKGCHSNGPLARYVKFQVAHAPGMPGTFSPPLWVSDPYMHHGTCITHVLWCMPGLLTSGFIWSRWPGKRSRHSRRMHNA